MIDAPTADGLAKMLKRLPGDEDATGSISLRLRLTTSAGRTIFAFARAGEGPLSFTGWEVQGEMTGEEEWDYFVLGAVVAAELEERGN